ncbi:HTH-type transcriptional repressor YtrA [Phycisphaerae bacterium RAS1]|nr:HTH-type transcriptional repressor YtrA [Phycisphaerae bacterium RAS1]
MRVDLTSHVPIYQQIADELRRAIAAGVYRSGEMLPSQRALAVKLVVNPNTVQRAYDELERAGITFSRKGLGMFVSDTAADATRASAAAALNRTVRDAIDAARAAGMSPAQIRAALGAMTLDGEAPASIGAAR